MKKLFLILTAIIAFSGLSFAQTAAPVAKPATTTKSVTKSSTSHVTKSGAPDKRFKENKVQTTTTVAPAAPVKKDGTPDMRYKANKTTTVKKSTTN